MKKKPTNYFRMALLLLLTIFAVSVNAQQSPVTITGKVDEAGTGKALPKATVFSTGGSRTITAEDGTFSLKVRTGDSVIIEFIGFERNGFVVESGKNYYPVSLKATNANMGDVVVTALGVKKEKKIIGYSTQEIKGEELIKAREPNAINGLAGKVAGLNVGISAELLGNPQLLLRGGNITLFVIDGVPITSDTWNLNPDDIESYTVLKGPVASALYGYRGQNGAIIITTKKGTRNKRGFVVEFNSSTQYNKGFIALPKTQDLYGPGDHGKYKFVDGKGGGINDNDYDIWGPKFEGQLIEQYDSPVDPVTGIRKPTPWVARGTNNLKRFIQGGLLTTNNISVASSNEKADLRFSVGQTYQRGIVPNTRLNGVNFNLNSTLRFNKKLSLDANLNYNRQFTDNVPDVIYGPNSIIYNITIWGGADWNIDDMRNYWQPGKEGVQSIYAEYQRYHNPYFMSYEWLRGHYKNDIYGYASLNYKINKTVELMLRSSISAYDILRTEKMPFSAHPYGREEGRGDYREDKRMLFENNTEFMAKVNVPRIAKLIDINGFVGSNLRSFSYTSSFVTTDYLNVPNVYTFANSRNPVKAYNFASDMRVLSAYASWDFSIGKYANINATGRVDKLSALFKSNNTFFYPSVSASTVITDYVSLPSAISFFKVRGSYAQVRGGGNFVSNTIGATPGNSYPLGYGAQYTSVYGGPSFANSSVYSTAPGYNNQTEARFSNALIDDNIKPDDRKSIELGLDIKFLKNRLGVDFAYFRYTDGPQIFSKQISAATGYTNYTLNATKTRRTGFEFSVSGTPLKMKNGLTWDVLFNWATYKEVFVELPAGVNALNTFYKVGSRTDEVYIRKFARTQDGRIINDAGGRPIILPVAQYAGNATARWTWALNNKFSYKAFTFSFQFDGRVGGVMEDYVRKKTFQGGRHIETVQGAFGDARYQDYLGVKSYVGEGVQVSNGIPIAYDANTGLITNYGSLQFANNTTKTFLQDYISRVHGIPEPNMMSKTYAKLREVVIGYTLPEKIIGKGFIQKFTLSLVGRNLLYFMPDGKFKDVDLDQYAGSQSSIDLQTPTTRSYGFNINITF